jgi:hypothetical protein
LLDGTIVRLAPESSVTFSEFNIGIKENFLFARINSGDVVWLSRHENPLLENNLRETDVLFFPLNLYEAEPTHEDKIFDPQNALAFLEDPQDVPNQIKKLNEFLKKNNLMTNNKPTYTYLLLSNISVMGYSPDLEFVTLIGGKSYLKNKNGQEIGYSENFNNELSYQLRGYDNKEIKKLEPGTWFEVDQKGRELKEDSDQLGMRVVGEFPSKRIPSILLAREILMDNYSSVCFMKEYDRLKLAKDHGYRLWGKIEAEENKKDDLYLRLEFLKEFTRRLETSNLFASQKLKERLQERGEKTRAIEYGNYFYKRALDKYFEFDNFAKDNYQKDKLNSETKLIWKMIHGIK